MENKLKSIFDIQFGSSKKIVHQIAESKGGVFDKEYSNEEISIFDGIKYAGYDTTFITFQFVNDKLARTVVNVSTGSDIDFSLKSYEDLKNKLNTKYFVTDKVYEFYEEPYEKSDLNAVKAQGLGSGLIEFSVYWMFNNDSICLEVTKELIVKINFENDSLISEKMDNNFNKDLDDM